MGRDKKLFKTDVNKLKVGVTSGHHVVHIIGEKNPNDGGVEITNELMRVKGQYREPGTEPTQAEVFSNPSDIKTKERFLEIAKLIAAEYEKPDIDEDYANFLIATKDYLLADSHSSQQTALAMLTIAANIYKENLIENAKRLKVLKNSKIQGNDIKNNPNNRILNKLEKEINDSLDKEKGKAIVFNNTVNKLKELLGPVNGSLEIPEDYKVPEKDEIQDPKGNNLFDKGGMWQPSNNKLFPHEPSPNDIKQGVGIMDCFVLSTLIQIAEQHPDEIKKRMKDNGNGTVTVKFNDKQNGNKPVFVTVKKTVNQTFFGQNYYAASSLWVQMLEKAYVEYNRITNTKTSKHSLADSKNGFASINRGSSEDFLNAFLGETFMSSTVRFPYSIDMKHAVKSQSSEEINKYFPKDKYLPEEETLAKFYMEKLHQGEIITVGVTPTEARISPVKYKDLGIRPGHAYTFRDIVKRKVNGVDKYFVQLRDPYASFKTGYDENGKLVNKSQAVKGFFNAGTDNMGTFEMEFRDFAVMFNSFCGISKNTMKELNSFSFRQYGTDPLDENELQNGVDETKERLSLSALDDKQGVANILKEEYVKEIESLVGDVSAVAWKDTQKEMTMEGLSDKDTFEKIQRNLTTAYNDLKGTDQWFVWTNTEKFAALRDNLAELNEMMAKAAKAQQGKDFDLDEKTRLAIAEKMMTVHELSIDYLASKNTEIRNNLMSGKSVSDRAVIRTLAAANIEAITGMSEPCSEWLGMTEKKLKLVTRDAIDRIDAYKNGLQIPHEDISKDKSFKGNEAERKALQIKINGQYKNQFIRASENLVNYLKKNEIIKDPEVKNSVAKIEEFNKKQENPAMDFVVDEDFFEEMKKNDAPKPGKSIK